MRRFRTGFGVLLNFLLIAGFPFVAFSQPLQNVEVRLATATERNEFRIGEPIRLTLSFTATADGYKLEQISSKPGSSHEEAVVSPKAGVFDWSNQYTRGRPHMDCVVSRINLSKSPAVVNLTLNDFVRFDVPGTYTVAFRTKRVVAGGANEHPKADLTTNEIRLTITEMSEADEAAETMRLSAAIDAAKGNWQEQTRLAEQLSYLTGQPSTIEKVKRYLNPLPNVPGNYEGEIRFGLFIARDRKLAAKTLYDAFRDPAREVRVDLVSTLASLQTLAETSGDAFYTDEHYSQVERRYLAELADSLDRRKGIPRGAAAITLLQKLPHQNPPADLLAKLRSILLKDFDTYNMYSREHLLNTYWHWLKDQSLVPSLERMLTDTSYPDHARVNVQTTAIKRLIELDNQKARPYVVALIRDPNALVSDEALDGLNVNDLPEVDMALLGRINALAKRTDNNFNPVRLRAKALVAARYASPAIYDQLLETYNQHSGSWQYDAKGILLGYFLKHDAPKGLGMLLVEKEKLDVTMRSSFFYDATRHTFPAEAAEYFENQLSSDEPETAATAAYILSQRGSLKHKELVQTRLDKWVASWSNRVRDLEKVEVGSDNARQVRLQVELISALTTAKAWQVSTAEREALRSRCLIEACRFYFPRNPNQ